MNIVLSLHKQWTEKILNKEKPFEFRNVLPKELNEGDTAFLYETGRNGGRKLIVGEVRVVKIMDLQQYNHRIGCYSFLKEFAENYHQFPDEDTKNIVLSNIDKIYNADILGCRDALCVHLFFDGLIDDILQEKDFDVVYSWIQRDHAKSFGRRSFAGQLFLEACDKWLASMGYYDENDQTAWKYAVQIAEPKRYAHPIPLSALNNRAGNLIYKAPQSWCYTSTSNVKDIYKKGS